MAFFVFGASAFAQQDAPHTETLWEYVSYPELTFSKSKHDPLTVLFDYRPQDEKATFRIDVNWWSANSKIEPGGSKKASQIKLHLHYPDGSIVEPVEQPNGPIGGTGNAQNTDWNQMYRFPYGPNKLVEAWVELSLPDRTYWLEIPYGFTRDPHAPLPPTEPDAGLPTLAPAMKHLGADDLIVPWTKVDYDLGPIQHGWRLALEQSNPFDAYCKVTLYREDKQWELDTPKTSVTIAEDGSGTLAARQSAARRTDMFRRVDSYDFPCDPGAEKQRDWGTLTIQVEGESRSIVIPSRPLQIHARHCGAVTPAADANQTVGLSLRSLALSQKTEDSPDGLCSSPCFAVFVCPLPVKCKHSTNQFSQ